MAEPKPVHQTQWQQSWSSSGTRVDVQCEQLPHHLFYCPMHSGQQIGAIAILLERRSAARHSEWAAQGGARGVWCGWAAQGRRRSPVCCCRPSRCPSPALLPQRRVHPWPPSPAAPTAPTAEDSSQRSPRKSQGSLPGRRTRRSIHPPIGPAAPPASGVRYAVRNAPRDRNLIRGRARGAPEGTMCFASELCSLQFLSIGSRRQYGRRMLLCGDEGSP